MNATNVVVVVIVAWVDMLDLVVALVAAVQSVDSRHDEPFFFGSSDASGNFKTRVARCIL